MRRKRKLALVVKSIDGGTGTYLLALQKLKGVDIGNFVLERPGYRKLPRRLKGSTLFFRPKGFYPLKYSLSLRGIRDFIDETLWLKRRLKEFNPDTVISVDVHANLLAVFTRMLLGKSFLLVLTTHINLEKTLLGKSSSFLRGLILRIAGFIYSRADFNVCVSKGVATSLKQTLKLKKGPLVIYNGVAAVGTTKRRKAGYEIVTLSRLDEQKDLGNLLKAFFLVRQKLSKARLTIVGDGPSKKRLVRLSKNLGLDGSAVFLGWSDFSRISQAEVFVLSSKREGLPWVLLEAMSRGFPVISTDTEFGPAEILGRNEYGLLVPVSSPEKLADSLYLLLTNKKKKSYYRRKSLERVKYFSEKKMLLNYQKLILDK